MKLKLEKAPKWEKARGAPELREAPLARTGCSGHALRPYWVLLRYYYVTAAGAVRDSSRGRGSRRWLAPVPESI